MSNPWPFNKYAFYCLLGVICIMIGSLTEVSYWSYFGLWITIVSCAFQICQTIKEHANVE